MMVMCQSAKSMIMKLTTWLFLLLASSGSTCSAAIAAAPEAPQNQQQQQLRQQYRHRRLGGQQRVDCSAVDDDVFHCQDPSEYQTGNIRCDWDTCEWIINFNPRARPLVCDEEAVDVMAFIDSNNNNDTDIPDKWEPCVLWEMEFGQLQPTSSPTVSPQPSDQPSSVPTMTDMPSDMPSRTPTSGPTIRNVPTSAPTTTRRVVQLDSAILLNLLRLDLSASDTSDNNNQNNRHLDDNDGDLRELEQLLQIHMQDEFDHHLLDTTDPFRPSNSDTNSKIWVQQVVVTWVQEGIQSDGTLVDTLALQARVQFPDAALAPTSVRLVQAWVRETLTSTTTTSTSNANARLVTRLQTDSTSPRWKETFDVVLGLPSDLGVTTISSSSSTTNTGGTAELDSSDNESFVSNNNQANASDNDGDKPLFEWNVMWIVIVAAGGTGLLGLLIVGCYYFCYCCCCCARRRHKRRSRLSEAAAALKQQETTERSDDEELATRERNNTVGMQSSPISSSGKKSNNPNDPSPAKSRASAAADDVHRNYCESELTSVYSYIDQASSSAPDDSRVDFDYDDNNTNDYDDGITANYSVQPSYMQGMVNNSNSAVSDTNSIISKAGIWSHAPSGAVVPNSNNQQHDYSPDKKKQQRPRNGDQLVMDGGGAIQKTKKSPSTAGSPSRMIVTTPQTHQVFGDVIDDDLSLVSERFEYQSARMPLTTPAAATTTNSDNNNNNNSQQKILHPRSLWKGDMGTPQPNATENSATNTSTPGMTAAAKKMMKTRSPNSVLDVAQQRDDDDDDSIHDDPTSQNGHNNSVAGMQSHASSTTDDSSLFMGPTAIVAPKSALQSSQQPQQTINNKNLLVLDQSHQVGDDIKIQGLVLKAASKMQHGSPRKQKKPTASLGGSSKNVDTNARKNEESADSSKKGQSSPLKKLKKSFGVSSRKKESRILHGSAGSGTASPTTSNNNNNVFVRRSLRPDDEEESVAAETDDDDIESVIMPGRFHVLPSSMPSFEQANGVANV